MKELGLVGIRLRLRVCRFGGVLREEEGERGKKDINLGVWPYDRQAGTCVHYVPASSHHGLIQ